MLVELNVSIILGGPLPVTVDEIGDDSDDDDELGDVVDEVNADIVSVRLIEVVISRLCSKC